MEILNAIRYKRPGSVSSIEKTELFLATGKTIECRLIRGAVTWPEGEHPGCILLGYRQTGQDQLEIVEERIFTDINQAIGIFTELWAYLPSVYYHRGDKESEAFISFLKRVPDLSGKIPFTVAHYPDAEGYGFRLIHDALDKNQLLIPADSPALAGQLQNATHDTPIDELFAVSGLRFLLAGIKEIPWEKELEDFNLESCLA